MLRTAAIATFGMVLMAATACSAQNTRWINVQVTNSREKANVEVRVPLGLVTTILNTIHTDGFHDGKVTVQLDKKAVDLAKLIEQVKSSPDGQYLRASDPNSDVVVEKKGDLLLINISERAGDRAQVEVRMPMALIGSVTVNEKNELDLSDMFAKLDKMTSGDLVRVRSKDADVRIWIE